MHTFLHFVVSLQSRFYTLALIFVFDVNIYSSNDACDVTLSVYPHRASLKNMPDHGGNRTYDLWNTSPMLCQLSYAVWSVRVCDISEQNLVLSISMFKFINVSLRLFKSDPVVSLLPATHRQHFILDLSLPFCWLRVYFCFKYFDRVKRVSNFSAQRHSQRLSINVLVILLR